MDRDYLRKNVDSFKNKGFGNEQVLKTPKHLQERGTPKSMASNNSTWTDHVQEWAGQNGKNWKQKVREAKVTKVSQTTFDVDTQNNFGKSTFDLDTETGFELTKLFFANLRGGNNGQTILIEGLGEDDVYKAAEGYFNTPSVIVQEVSREDAEQSEFIGSSEPDIVTPEAMRVKSNDNSQDGYADVRDDFGDMNDNTDPFGLSFDQNR